MPNCRVLRCNARPLLETEHSARVHRRRRHLLFRRQLLCVNKFNRCAIQIDSRAFHMGRYSGSDWRQMVNVLIREPVSK